MTLPQILSQFNTQMTQDYGEEAWIYRAQIMPDSLHLLFCCSYIHLFIYSFIHTANIYYILITF